jgi:transposase
MSLAEVQYEVIRPLLPVQRGNVRIANLDVINAVLYVAENGSKWRSLAERFGNWHTIDTRLRGWAEAGVLERLLRRLTGFRRTFSRFEKRDIMLTAFIHFALIVDMLCVNMP